MSDLGGPEGGESTDDPTETAFGWWPSPWSASVVAAGKISRSGLQADGDWVYWSEGRPDDGGRQVVVRAKAGTSPVDLSPAEVSVRSRVHEYGGGAAIVSAGSLFYVDQADQRWHRVAAGEESSPIALSPELPPAGAATRYADGRVTPSGQWLVSIEERVEESTTGHRLVALPTDGSQSVVPLVDRGDFVTAPRPSPDGHWLAWVTWDHPAMPWDSSQLWVAPLNDGPGVVGLDPGHPVAGGGGVSVGQPRWCRDGSLLFVDDRSGWWLPYRLNPEQLVGGGPAHCLVDRRSEFHTPDWVVGQSTMAELSDGSLVCRMHEDGRDQVVRLCPPGPADDRSGGTPWAVETIDQPCVSISGLVALPTGGGPDGPRETPPANDRVYVIGSTRAEAHLVVEIGPGAEVTARRLTVRPSPVAAADDVSTARPFSAPTPAGPVPGLFFPPASSRFVGPSGRRPPLVVFCHGGPTSAAEVGFDPVVQFFTSRGLAVAAVDYRGSSGYGRAHRRALDGLWGEADVDDCVAYADSLADVGWVDGGRMAIRGTSAGGLTALGALIRSRRFAGAAVWYGVTDLESLVADTHDFESRYLDSLVGEWPRCAEVYRARSPLHHPEKVSGAVLLLQGEDDPVVPATQSRRFAQQLRRHQVPCRLIVFDGESHGFRRADTIEASLTAELEFYRSVFGEPHAPTTGAAPP